MRGATFDPREVEAERHVIAEERARDLDSPLGRLDQTHLAAQLPPPPLPQPDPRLARRPGADRRRRPPRASTGATTGPTAPCSWSSATSSPTGPSTGRGALRRRSRRAGRRRPAPAVDEPRQIGRRDFTLVEPESVARGLLRLAHGPPRPPRRPGARRPLRPPDLRPAVAALGRAWSSASGSPPGSTPAQEGARRAGQFLLQVEAAPGRRARRGSSGRSPRSIGRLADEGPTAEELARSRHRLEAAWRWEQEDLAGPGRRARPGRPLGRLAGLAGRAPRGAGRRGRRHPPGRLDLPGRRRT